MGRIASVRLRSLDAIIQVYFDASEAEESLEWDFTDIQIKLSPTSSVVDGSQDAAAFSEVILTDVRRNCFGPSY